MSIKSGNFLPLEIVELIIHYLPDKKDSQGVLYSISLVSKLWYGASVARLYAHPYLEGNNFETFVRTVCPSVNAHIRPTALADLVRVLDMSRLVHDSSRSMTARILSRLKPQLEKFVAPCTTFSLNSFSALSKCFNLLFLDLSYVTEYLSLDRLFNAIGKLPKLRTLRISRTTVSDAVAARLRLARPHNISGPPGLKELHLCGNTSSEASVLLLDTCENLDSLHLSTLRAGRSIESRLIWELCPDLRSLIIGPKVEELAAVDYERLCTDRVALKELTLNTPEAIITFHLGLRSLMVQGMVSNLRSLTLNWIENEPGRAEIAQHGGIDLELLFDAVSSESAPPLGQLEKLVIRYPSRFVNESIFQEDLAELGQMMEALSDERAERDGRTLEPQERGVWLTAL